MWAVVAHMEELSIEHVLDSDIDDLLNDL
jgi:hypothetical protein